MEGGSGEGLGEGSQLDMQGVVDERGEEDGAGGGEHEATGLKETIACDGVGFDHAFVEEQCACAGCNSLLEEECVCAGCYSLCVEECA